MRMSRREQVLCARVKAGTLFGLAARAESLVESGGLDWIDPGTVADAIDTVRAEARSRLEPISRLRQRAAR